LPVSRAFFYISLELLIKVILIKRNFTLLLKALGKEHPPMFPKMGLYGNRRPFPEPYMTYPSGSPVKEPSLQVPLIELPQTERLCSRALLHSSFKVPGIRAPFYVLQRSPYGERCPFPEPSFT
jgi:hypothetical protein